MTDRNLKRIRVAQVVDGHWERIGRDDEHDVAIVHLFSGICIWKETPIFWEIHCSLVVPRQRDKWTQGKREALFTLHKKAGCGRQQSMMHDTAAQLGTSC